MPNDDLAREEKAFSGAIDKIKLLKEVKPKENWVIFCRANLAMRMEMEHKKELLNQDLFTLKELFSFLKRADKPKHSFKLAPIVSLSLAIILAAGGLTAWAATKSLPGGVLYKVKIAMEKAHLLVVSEESRNKLQSEMVSRRLNELKTVLDSPGSAEDKKGKVEEVVGHIQQQLVIDKEQFPKNSQKNESEKSIATAKEMVSRAEQVKKAISEAKESLPAEMKANLNERLTEVTEAADKTSLQVLEMMINKSDKTEVDKKEILVRFNEIIGEKETAIKNLKIENVIAQATSTADRLPINAVLINQSDQALELLGGLKEDLEKGDFPAALEALKALNEIVKGAERIVESSRAQNEIQIGTAAEETKNGTSTIQTEPINK